MLFLLTIKKLVWMWVCRCVVVVAAAAAVVTIMNLTELSTLTEKDKHEYSIIITSFRDAKTS